MKIKGISPLRKNKCKSLKRIRFSKQLKNKTNKLKLKLTILGRSKMVSLLRMRLLRIYLKKSPKKAEKEEEQ